MPPAVEHLAPRDKQPPPLSVVAPDFYFNEASTITRFAWQKHSTIGTRHDKVGTIIYRKTNKRPLLEEYITINQLDRPAIYCELHLNALL
jgi:hypothetical protein